MWECTTYISHFTDTFSGRNLFIGFGFNSGSALNLPIAEKGLVAANAAVATVLSGASGGISALFTNLFLVERRTGEYTFIILMATNGALSGLVAISSGCAVVEPWAALVVGTIAGWIYLWSSSLLERLRIDDAVNAIPVHMFNGMWGLLATGLLASPNKLELTYGDSNYPGFFYSLGQGNPSGILLACQAVTLIFIVGWTLFTMLPFFFWLNYRGWLRSDSYEELVGLDISYHGGGMRFNVDNGVGIQFIEAHKRQTHNNLPRLSQHQSGMNHDPAVPENELDSRKTSRETPQSSQAGMDSPLGQENRITAYEMSRVCMTSPEPMESEDNSQV